MKTTIFISRALETGAPFLQLQERHPGCEIIGESLVSFRALAFRTPPPADYVFFYSRRAVHFFYSQLNGQSISAQAACIGAGTASALAQYGVKPVFIGRGSPLVVASDFYNICKGKKVLFPRARTSRRTVERALSGKDCELSGWEVYDNLKKKAFPHPGADMLVFTSPLNAEAYFDAYPYDGESLFAIGKTTAGRLSQMGLRNAHIPETPSMPALAELVEAHLDE